MGIFGNALGWPHLLIIVAVVLVLFGASKLPLFAKGLGQSIKIFRKEVHDLNGDVDGPRLRGGDTEKRSTVAAPQPTGAPQHR